VRRIARRILITDANFVAQCGDHAEKITTKLQAKGMQPGDGYGPAKKSQLRFANFPTHSKEQFELLVDTLM
jgi:phosphoserine aminotransferase